MRNFLILICGVIFGGLLIGSLAGCAGKPAEEVEDAPAVIQAAPSLEATEPLTQEARDAYAGLLRQVLENQTLPDGTLLDCAGTDTLNWNDFALYDLDGNGIAELVLNWVNSSMAGMMEAVFTYDPAAGEVRELLRAFPGTTFYSNGTAESPWSHNQGLAGRFWPYDLFQLNLASGVYEAVGAADAWDKSYRPDDFSGSAFPDALDKDGDGFLYYLLPGDWRDSEDSVRCYDSPIDGPEYEQWKSQYTGGAEVLTLDLMALTEDNIAAAFDAEEPYGIPSLAVPEDDTADEEDTAGKAESGASPENPPEAVQSPTPDKIPFVQSSVPAPYAEAISAYCRSGVYPDGGDCGMVPSRISYAVCDVDGDGKDELILKNTDTATAGQTERIYGYDGGAFHLELEEFAALTYYDNGVIKADWSHNQGKAGEFWPYNLYTYRAESDEWQAAGSVDAWDKSLVPEGFPEESDADGDGFVYYLLPAPWDGNYNAPVDGPAYKSWLDSCLNGAAEIEIPYVTLDVTTVYPAAKG